MLWMPLSLRPHCEAETPLHQLCMQDGSRYRVVLNAEGSICRQPLLEWITKEED